MDPAKPEVLMRLFNWFKSETTPKSIEWSVRRALYADPRLRDLDAARIRIAANEAGEVVLAGAVSTPGAREWSEQIARKIPAVRTVRNDLRIDAVLTKQLREMLQADSRLKALAKDSVVFQGRAELRGPATYDAQLAAVQMAQSIDGVRAVDNYMQLAVSQADLKTAA
jgi:osmotically-inducible protein OsmY